MATVLRAFWARVRDSLWFIPGVMTLLAILLAWAAIEIDKVFQTALPGLYFTFQGGAEGARGVLAAIAGTLITVTSVVFSITIVALQLASTQFTPRILRTFSNDRANQLALGIFIGAFTYTLLVLRTIRSGEGEGQFVPAVAVGLAVLLALVSIAFLIYFIHHAARQIRLEVILDRITVETKHAIQRRFPEREEEQPPERLQEALQALEHQDVAIVRAQRSGYLQMIDLEGLFNLAEKEHMIIRVEVNPGTYVIEREPLASIWPSSVRLQALEDKVRRNFVLGSDRTLDLDVSFGFRQIADIGIKAISPGINAPTTALMCIDRLAELLVEAGNRGAIPSTRWSEDGRLCLLAPARTFTEIADISFDQIRHYGAGSPWVAAYLLQALGRIGALVPPDRWPALAEQAGNTLRSARDQLDDPSELARVEAVAAVTAKILERGGDLAAAGEEAPREVYRAWATAGTTGRP